MSLRQNWEAAKSKALKEFKNFHPLKPGMDLHTTPPPAFPLAFKEDFGPTLDKWEKAKPGDEKSKYAAKAYAVMSSYSVQIDKAEKLPKGALGPQATATLKSCLKAIKDDISKVQAENEKGRDQQEKKRSQITTELNHLAGYLKDIANGNQKAADAHKRCQKELEAFLSGPGKRLDLRANNNQMRRVFPGHGHDSQITFSQWRDWLQELIEEARETLKEMNPQAL